VHISESTLCPPGGDAPEEWHIAGVAVHVHPEHLASVQAALVHMSGVEVHASSPEGKLVVTLEAPTPRAIAAQLDGLNHMEGVLSAALVYQHGEEASAMQEEIADGHAP